MRTPAAILAALLSAAAPAAAQEAPPAAAAGTPGASGTGIDPAVLNGVPVAATALRTRPAGLTTARAARRAGFRSLSDLTGGAYPAFTPKVGAVYVRRDGMPYGPYLAFDHRGRLVSTIYKLPLDKMADKSPFEGVGVRTPPSDHFRAYFGGSHPGADFPHYDLVFWHVPEEDEARVAK